MLSDVSDLYTGLPLYTILDKCLAALKDGKGLGIHFLGDR